MTVEEELQAMIRIVALLEEVADSLQDPLRPDYACVPSVVMFRMTLDAKTIVERLGTCLDMERAIDDLQEE